MRILLLAIFSFFSLQSLALEYDMYGATDSDGADHFGNYTCQLGSFGEIEVELKELPLGNEKVTYMKVVNGKNFRTQTDVDTEGIATKRSVPGVDTYYDLAIYSLRFNARNNEVTLNNYKSTGGSYRCRRSN